MHSCIAVHSLTDADRMGNPKINFPVAMAFGDQDYFSSDRGAEEILNKVKENNDG